MSIIANHLGLSPSEVHGAIKRLQNAKLLHGPEMKSRPNISALEEFLIHGLKYTFPAAHGQLTRGLPTSYAAPPLNAEIFSKDDIPPVWPWPQGNVRGIAFEPLYRSAPVAALQDPLLYEFLALLDAIRDGRARERKIAERELIKRLHSVNAKS
jgi:DNA-binding Lrp family transcriptional regulator